MPEFLVSSMLPKRSWLTFFLVLLCAMLFQSVAVKETSNGLCTKSTYDPNTKIDEKLSCEFVAFWASGAFAYHVQDPLTGPQAAEKWTSNQSLINQLKKTYWSTDFQTRPSRCKVISIGNPCILDDKSTVVDLCAVFSWDSVGLKEVPIKLEIFVKKESEGYRVVAVTTEYQQQMKSKGMLFFNGDTAQLYFLRGKSFLVAKSYREAVENLKPNLADKPSFDTVFFCWYKRLSSTL